MPQYVCLWYLAIGECSIFVSRAFTVVLGVDRLLALTVPIKFALKLLLNNGFFSQIQELVKTYKQSSESDSFFLSSKKKS
jgi:hypothetical protein